MKPFLLLLLLFVVGYSDQRSEQSADLSIIPQPNSIVEQSGTFTFKKRTEVLIPEGDEWDLLEDEIRSRLSEITKLEIRRSDLYSIRSGISFKQETSMKMPLSHKDGYRLTVEQHMGQDIVNITASHPEGAFYALQSLFQLMSPEIYSKDKPKKKEWTVPFVEIEDAPRFPYRGMHLDVARHFFDVAAVKRYIDQLAIRKLNYFHWHLTEDQGWRIEIERYPKLTEIGAWRNGTLIGHYNDQPQQFDGKRYGGFYTKEEVREVVAYAESKFITVIPEIEMPGHAQAAIAAYPELGCTGEKFEVMQKWGISDNVYCPTEATFVFLENVLTEVIDLFPGKYIHIGGDECPKTQWKQSQFCHRLMEAEGMEDEYELQSYFIQRIEKFINSKGRKIIGWDEILEGGLAPNATVMSWRGEQGGIDAANENHNVIMTPTSNCYFDYYQSDDVNEPLAIGGLLPFEKVYNYDPIPEALPNDKHKFVLGAQGNVWTEYMSEFSKVEYMAMTRMATLAEVVWGRNSSDLDAFSKVLFVKVLIWLIIF